MSYNYLSLVNDINRRLNEVELIQTNFTGATGYYSFAKDSINSAIRHIQQEAYEWPWNHVEASEVLNPSTARYSSARRHLAKHNQRNHARLSVNGSRW